MAVDPASPSGYSGHYNCLIRQYICHRMRPVSAIRSVALSCNTKITYNTKTIKKYFGSNAKVLLDTVAYMFLSLNVLKFLQDDFEKSSRCTLLTSLHVTYIIFVNYTR